MEIWLATYHRDKFVPIMFGYLEVFTEEMAREYAEWCLTEEGRQYLQGGSKYDPNHRGNIASAKARAIEEG
jgi:hypothetical protein